MRLPVASLVVGLLLGASLAACGAEHPTGSSGRFTPRRVGTLTVATSLPAPGFWDPTGGFERDLAEALVDQLGLDQLRIVDVPFERLITGEARGFDLGLAQVSVTDERRTRVDFSRHYLVIPVGVVGTPERRVPDLATARTLRWGVVTSTTEVDVVDDQLRPDKEPRTYDDREALLAAVTRGEVDVAALDFAEALAPVADHPGLAIIAQVAAPQRYGAVLPKGSENREAVDAALRALEADGTLRRLRNQLYERYDVDPDRAPTIRVPE